MTEYDYGLHGFITITPALSAADHEYLTRFCGTRHMTRRGLDPKYGIDGAFFVPTTKEDELLGVDLDNGDHNTPPKMQPSLHCCWEPTADGTRLVWNGIEKIQRDAEWLTYMEDTLMGGHYTLSGEIVGRRDGCLYTLKKVDGEWDYVPREPDEEEQIILAAGPRKIGLV